MAIVKGQPMTLSLTDTGVMGFDFGSDVADYRFYLRCCRAGRFTKDKELLASTKNSGA